jgi:hypothetical protein
VRYSGSGNGEVKIKLPLYLAKYHAVKTYPLNSKYKKVFFL